MCTYLMCDSKCSVEPVVLDDSTTSLRRADGANICHAQGVAGVVATEVLDRGKTVSLNLNLNQILFISEFNLEKWSSLLHFQIKTFNTVGLHLNQVFFLKAYQQKLNNTILKMD